MDRISELLDNVQISEVSRHLPKVTSVYYRWMVEATNRLQEQDFQIAALLVRVEVLEQREVKHNVSD